MNYYHSKSKSSQFFSMVGIVKDAGLTIEEFKKLL
jgi:hypothetical protein